MKIKFPLISSLLTASVMLFGSCSGGTNEPPPDPNPDPDPDTPASLVKGADISWLSEMEEQNIPFYYSDGTKGDCMNILKSLGINTFRFRLWVNPENSYNSTADVISKAKRAAALGVDIMLDFHYSDSWADPSKQTVPVAWTSMNIDQLVDKVGSYTTETLSQFKAQGIDVKWVQVGNETGNGMLWPYGQADKNPAGYARLNNAGYDAVKKIFPQAKVIVHVQNGQDSSLNSWLFSVLKNNGGKWDVCGMSLYPDKSNYATYVAQCSATMKTLIEKYGKDTMLCEIGMGNAYVSECYTFISQCLEMGKDLGNHYLGVLYWEPQVYNDWNGYRMGAFTSQGRPSDALDAFSKFPQY